MKNKFLVLFLASIMVLGMVGCSNRDKQDTTKQNTTEQDSKMENMVGEEEYYDIYTRNYESSLTPLQQNYQMYGNINTVEDYYKENDYPGNQKYLEEVRTALTESRDNVQQFIDNMEKDAKSNDEKINKLNKEMIDEGRDLIENIDERLEKLDKISDEDLKKSDTEFRRMVGENIMFEEGEHDFRNMLRNLDKELNIDRKDMLDTTK